LLIVTLGKRKIRVRTPMTPSAQPYDVKRILTGIPHVMVGLYVSCRTALGTMFRSYHVALFNVIFESLTAALLFQIIAPVIIAPGFNGGWIVFVTGFLKGANILAVFQVIVVSLLTNLFLVLQVVFVVALLNLFLVFLIPTTLVKSLFLAPDFGIQLFHTCRS
jgi:hypothetical protein